MKIILSMLILLAFAYSHLLADEKNEVDAKNRFPENNLAVETMKIITDITSGLDEIKLVDSISIIQNIDAQYLKNLINPAKPTILFFWTSIAESKPNFELWKSLVKNDKYDIFIIALDASTSAQIKLLRKLFIQNDFTDRTYILYNRFNSPHEIIQEAKTFDKASIFVNSIDKNSEDFNLPYALILKTI